MNPFQDTLLDGLAFRIRSKPKLISGGVTGPVRERNDLLFARSHLLTESNDFSDPENGAVMVDNFN